jgi:3-isopropylmalate dehydratase small subunit
LNEQEVEDLLAMLESEECKLVDIDLHACRVTFPDGSVHPFKLDGAQRESLLQGLDPITLAARHEDDIAAFQQRDRQVRPWIWPTGS